MMIIKKEWRGNARDRENTCIGKNFQNCIFSLPPLVSCHTLAHAYWNGVLVTSMHVRLIWNAGFFLVSCGFLWSWTDFYEILEFQMEFVFLQNVSVAIFTCHKTYPFPCLHSPTKTYPLPCISSYGLSSFVRHIFYFILLKLNWLKCE
jgi:hypothetical protein